MTDRWTIDFDAQPPAWVLDALGKSADQPGAADWDGQGEGLWVNTATRGGRLAPLGAELLRDANGGLHIVDVPPGWRLVPVAAPPASDVDEAQLARLIERGTVAWATHPGPIELIESTDSEGGTHD